MVVESFSLVGKVSFVSRSDGEKFTGLELEGKGWIFLSPEEFVPKKDCWVEAKGVISPSGRKVVQYWRGLTQPEVKEQLEVQGERLALRKEGQFRAGLDLEASKFKDCWFEALTILGFRQPEKFRAVDEPEVTKTAYKIAFTLYNRLN